MPVFGMFLSTVAVFNKSKDVILLKLYLVSHKTINTFNGLWNKMYVDDIQN